MWKALAFCLRAFHGVCPNCAISAATSAGVLPVVSLPQGGFAGSQGNAVDRAAFQMQPPQNGVPDVLLVQHPAEDHVLVGCTGEEIVQQVTDIVQHHGASLGRDLKRGGVPTPIAVQEYTVGEGLLELLADRGFPYAHGPADQIEMFHQTVPPLLCASGGKWLRRGMLPL